MGLAELPGYKLGLRDRVVQLWEVVDTPSDEPQEIWPVGGHFDFDEYRRGFIQNELAIRNRFTDAEKGSWQYLLDNRAAFKRFSVGIWEGIREAVLYDGMDINNKMQLWFESSSRVGPQLRTRLSRSMRMRQQVDEVKEFVQNLEEDSIWAKLYRAKQIIDSRSLMNKSRNIKAWKERLAQINQDTDTGYWQNEEACVTYKKTKLEQLQQEQVGIDLGSRLLCHNAARWVVRFMHETAQKVMENRIRPDLYQSRSAIDTGRVMNRYAVSELNRLFSTYAHAIPEGLLFVQAADWVYETRPRYKDESDADHSKVSLVIESLRQHIDGLRKMIFGRRVRYRHS